MLGYVQTCAGRFDVLGITLDSCYPSEGLIASTQPLLLLVRVVPGVNLCSVFVTVVQ